MRKMSKKNIYNNPTLELKTFFFGGGHLPFGWGKAAKFLVKTNFLGVSNIGARAFDRKVCPMRLKGCFFYVKRGWEGDEFDFFCWQYNCVCPKGLGGRQSRTCMDII